MKKSVVLIALSLFTTSLSCQSPSQVVEPLFQVTPISGSQLPQQLTEWTYSYKFTTVNPESLLAVLVKSGIPVSQAWLPLDNLCMDPVGPRFTIELTQQDDRVFNFDFVRGTGRLACATHLKWYRLSQ